MLLTVFCVPKDQAETTFALDVSPELELRDFMALCELESGIPAAEIQIFYADQPLRDLTRALGNYGLKDGDVIVLRQAERRPAAAAAAAAAAAQPAFPGLPRIDFSSIAVPGMSSDQGSTQVQQPRAAPTLPAASPASPASPASSPQGLDNPALLRDMLLANPHELSLLKERNPPLAEALLSGDLERFTKVLLEQQQDRAKREQERIRLFSADPFDLEAQAKIEEDIRQHNIEENMTIAMEEAPESFGQVVMLYINCKVNGHPVKAFVDSGAQMTIMSQACAERCNIMRLVDRRWAGIAKGVGTQKIIGRVHLAQVQIEGDFLPCSFSILEDQPMDMLLGLDMLKRHQCSIDLKKSVLVIGTTGTETRFLSEAELPDCARLAYGPEGREDSRPEEIADQELAEALQKSIQDSETADGKTTSPQSLPLSLCKSVNDPSPSSSHTSHSRSFTLDRSKSSPASIHQSSPQEGSFSSSQTQGETSSHLSDTQGMTEHHSTAFEGSESSISSKATSSLQNPHCGQVDPIEPMSQPVSDTTLPNNRATDYIFPPILPTQEKISSTVSEDNEVTDLVICGESNANKTNVGESIILQESEETDTPFNNLNTNSTTDVCSQEVDMAEISSSQNPDQLQQKEQGSIVQDSLNSQEGQLSEWTMHHNVPGPDGTTEQTLEKNMEVRPASESLMASERDQMEVEKIPSLADALKELHNLLMSNVQACGTSPPPASHTTTSCSNSYGVNRDPAREDDASLNTNINSSSSTATTSKTVFAKSEPDTLEEDDTSEEMSVTSQGQEDDRTEGFENITQQAESHCSVLFKGGAVGENSEGLMSDMEEAPLVQDQQVGQAENGMNPDHKPLNSAEPFEEHPSSVAAGLTADSSNLVQVESTHSSTEGSELAPHPTADSTQPSTVNLTEQYPAEHIQRIQAAGFSAHEATEALELAEGSVELALLVLLARKITVPI